MLRRLHTRVVLAAFGLSASALALPSINAPVVTPSVLVAGQMTQVTASCQINSGPSDPTLNSGGVNLIRVPSNGTASVVGVMADSGSGLFTLQFSDAEAAAGSFQLQCSAAFKGVLQRVKSPLTTVTVNAGGSNDSIGAPTLAPSSVAYGVATSVTITAAVSGDTPDSGSVLLQRLDSSGRVVGILGIFHDDGLNGDLVANDGTYTLVTSFTEFQVGSVPLRLSATFANSVNHALSPVVNLAVTGTPPPTVTITQPANLAYLNLAPTTVTGTVSDPSATVVINSINAPVDSTGKFAATIPLQEGPNILTATATSSGGSAATSSITVTLDTTPPHVTVTSPVDQFMTTAPTISVAGNVNDIVVGTVNSQQAAVTVNGVAAQVANRTFLAPNIPLSIGSNTIQVVAVDRAGNSVTTHVTVTRTNPQPGQITIVSGNNQSATIGSTVSAPLVVSLTDSSGAPAVNKPVLFSVTQNNGMLAVNGGTAAPSVIANTDATGRASATWTLGMRSGAGSDAVQAYSVGYSGTAVFTASAGQGTPGLIVVDTGNNQTGAVNQPLAKPLIAVVIDAGHNRLPNVPVTFTVVNGGGSFAGQPTRTVTTDSDGRAAALFTLGFQEGNSNNLVSATFSGNTSFPASFTASALGPGDPNATVISGLVLDNSNSPVAGVTVRALLTNSLNATPATASSAPSVETDATGHFSIYRAPAGYVKLFIDGSTATITGTFPSLEYDMVTVAGQINTVGQTIFLVPLVTANKLCVTDTTGGGTLTIPEAPGFSLTFGPGQVTFPGGTKTGCVSVSVVHPDKVPMQPGFGQQPRFIVTIQPSGALFNPPAPITLPNVDGLKPREVTEMYSYDHDISSFVAIGTGSVSDDGQVIRSNSGVGVLKAGWHCGGNASQTGSAATCPVCMFCQGTTCTPQGNGTSCGNGGLCQFTGQTTAPVCVCPAGQVFNTTTNTCVDSGPCPAGYSVVNGQCCQGATCRQPQCPTGLAFDPTTGTCVNNSPCSPGYTLVAEQCCQGTNCVPPKCPQGLIFNATTGTCQVLMCGNGQVCTSPNPCIDASCSADNQCLFSSNQFCQNACNGATSGSCSVDGVSGMCDASGNCNLCPSVGAGASCTCSAGVTGTCDTSGQCTGCGPRVDINFRTLTNPVEIYVRQGTETYISSTLTAVGMPAGGTYNWLSTDPTVLDINASNDVVRITGLKPGNSTLFVGYSVNGTNVGQSVLVHVFYPIILVHGINSNALTWSSLIADLVVNKHMKYGGDCKSVVSDLDFCAVNFGTDPITIPWGNQSDFVTEGSSLVTDITNVRLSTGANKVTLLGHSMGGLASRAAIQLFGQGAFVDKLITIGTPHLGSWLAALNTDAFAHLSVLSPIVQVASGLNPNSPGVASLAPGNPKLNSINSAIMPHQPQMTNISIVSVDTSLGIAATALLDALVVSCKSNATTANDLWCTGLSDNLSMLNVSVPTSDLLVTAESQNLNNVFPSVGAFVDNSLGLIHTSEPSAVPVLLRYLGF